MSDILTWANNKGFIIKNGDRFYFQDKPDVINGQPYNAIYYEPATNNLRKEVDGKDFNLTVEEQTSIVGFISAFTIPVYSHYVDSYGKYLGQGQFIGTVVPSPPPLDANYYWSGSWVKTNGVDASGIFIGNAPVDDITLMTISPEDGFQIWNFDTSAFEDTRTPADFIASANAEIDRKAGDVRLKYITDVTGQSETYMEKRQDAEDYVADPAPNIDNYIYVKGESIARGITADAAAAYILDTAAWWRIKGAQIEQARTKGKALQVITSDVPALKLALNISIAELDGM